MPLKFTKMQGTGNDFVVIDAFTRSEVEERFNRDASASLVSAMCDRHYGVGADGVLVVCRPAAGQDAQLKMRIFNSDGCESEMCGNGLRCVAKYAHDRLGTRSSPLRVVTGRGILQVHCRVERGVLTQAMVDMGAPILSPDNIPIDRRVATATENPVVWDVAAGSNRLRVACVSMGNPHAVQFVPDIGAVDLARVGPSVEKCAAFPAGTNFHIAEVAGPVTSGSRHTEVRMRTWERGVGLTLACGTGACAVVVAGSLMGVLDRSTLVHMPGGDVQVDWLAGRDSVVMSGPAAEVFQGEWPD